MQRELIKQNGNLLSFVIIVRNEKEEEVPNAWKRRIFRVKGSVAFAFAANFSFSTIVNRIHKYVVVWVANGRKNQETEMTKYRESIFNCSSL